MKKIVWFSRPGVESTLIPNAGKVQEWITSIEVVRRRIGYLYGRIHRLSTSKRRNSLGDNWLVGIIKESKLIFWKSEYSYLQYHWWPILFKVSLLIKVSSVRYKILREGIAIKIKINMGIIVQISSIALPWSRKRLVILFLIIIDKIEKIIIVIKIRVIIVKSWKKIIISKIGELEFWKLIDHVLIFNKRFKSLFKEFKSNALICHIKKLLEFHYNND